MYCAKCAELSTDFIRLNTVEESNSQFRMLRAVQAKIYCRTAMFIISSSLSSAKQLSQNSVSENPRFLCHRFCDTI